MDAVSTADAVTKSGNDSKVVGNPDNWQLLTKFSSKSLGVAKSSKACEIEGVGCIVQVTTKEGDSVAEALTFVPGVKIVGDINDGRKLVQM